MSEQPRESQEVAATDEFRLKPEWPQVTRLSRRALDTLGAIAAGAILGALVFALQSRNSHQEKSELYSTDHKTIADALEKLPKDYTGLPEAAAARPINQLGPPLPGDLGRAILNTQGGTPNAEEQRSAQEDEAARVSRLFATINVRQDAPAPAAAPPTSNPGTTGASPTADVKPSVDAGSLQNMQEHKLAFLNASTDKRTVSGDALAPPPSRYVVQAGAIIPAALITGIRSDLPGEITAQITENVYDSPSGKFLLIPQGARLIGQYDNQISFGQSRVLLIWKRIIMPNGFSIVLEHEGGADSAGYAGLEDDVDYHWGSLLKAAAISTLLGIGSELVLNSNNAVVQALRTGTQDTINQSGQTLVSRQLNVQPTLTIRPGFPVRVIVNRDLIFAPYKG
jgi:type IV secretory pathway VirB10-like protein